MILRTSILWLNITRKKKRDAFLLTHMHNYNGFGLRKNKILFIFVLKTSIFFLTKYDKHSKKNGRCQTLKWVYTGKCFDR